MTAKEPVVVDTIATIQLVPQALLDEMAELALRPLPYWSLVEREAPRPLPLRAKLRHRWRVLRQRLGFWIAGYEPGDEWW